MASSGQRTEPPTPRRLREARRRGQIAASRDLVSAAVLTAAVGAVALTGASIGARVADLARRWLALAVTVRSLTPADAQLQLDAALNAMLSAVAPIAGAALAACVLVGGTQTRGLFSAQPIAPKGERLNPVAGFKRLFGLRSTVELAKTVVKAAIVAGAVWSVAPAALAALARLADNPREDALTVALSLVAGIAWRAAAAMLFVGVADVVVQHRLHTRELRMSKDEVRRDHKEDEGDPHIKNARRQAHREIALQRMVLAAGTASFVAVNPTHLATAVLYDAANDEAPRVVAKGAGDIARRIRRMAEQAGVRIVHDKPLARSLYRVPLDAEIPEELYAVVAEVLAVIRREHDRASR